MVHTNCNGGNFLGQAKSLRNALLQVDLRVLVDEEGGTGPVGEILTHEENVAISCDKSGQASVSLNLSYLRVEQWHDNARVLHDHFALDPTLL